MTLKCYSAVFSSRPKAPCNVLLPVAVNRGSTSGSAGQGSPEPPPPPPPRNGDLPLDSSGLGSSLNDSNNSSNQFSEAECDHDLVQRNYGGLYFVYTCHTLKMIQYFFTYINFFSIEV